MSKFNAVKPKTVPTTTNFAGGSAYKTSSRYELVSLLLTSFVEDKYYETASEQLARLYSVATELIESGDAKFVANAAYYARNEFGMRSISQALAVIVVGLVKGEQWTKDFIYHFIRRPDDMTEMVAFHKTMAGGAIPNSMKKGLALAFDKFNAYHLAKYRMEGKSVNLVDVVNLVHPVPTIENADALKLLVNDKLRNTNTWETVISGSTEEDKTANWGELVTSGKIGYMALLKNLVNILESGSDVIDDVVNMLTNKKLIQNSLVFPFRYLTALKMVEGSLSVAKDRQKVISALNKAIDISIANIPEFRGNTLIALDESGSMVGKEFEIGSLFAAVLLKRNSGAELLCFDTDARFMRKINTDDGALSIARSLNPNGGGTNFNLIFSSAKTPYDRIIILSDMQAWVDDAWGYSHPGKSFNDYKFRTGASPRIYSFDLAGYGTLQFPEEQVCAISGFSDKVLIMMGHMESDPNLLINTINNNKLF